MKQVYVPRKVEEPVKPALLPSIIIGSMEAPIDNSNKPIVIGGQTPASKQDEAPKGVARVEEKKNPPRDPRYTQPKWCPTELDKTQRRKL